MNPKRRRAVCWMVVTGTTLASCTVYRTPKVAPLALPATADSMAVESPVKVHLLDGSTALFPLGVIVARDTVRSAAFTREAIRYGLALEPIGLADRITLDSVLGMEVYRNDVNTGASAILSLLVLAPTVAATVAIVECVSNPKCFGSCPTFYSDSAGTPVLEAEGFSYSIAPLFEARDVDRLRAGADGAGELQLEVRNEALETHYINQLGLLEVVHTADEFVLPDPHDQPLATRGFVSPTRARDRAGRDVLPELVAADGRTFRSAAATLDGVTTHDPTDFVDLTFPEPAGRDSVALLFRMRNSLLNTVLLYELMLGDPGPRSLDWVGRDLQQIGPAARLGRWYVEHMGMRVAVRDGTTFRAIARIPDTGPVAWKDVAVVVPVPPGDSLRVRLSFVTDDWRIDQVRLARSVRHAPARVLEPIAVMRADGHADTAALATVRDVDERYLVTSPGQRFGIRFRPGPPPVDSVRTFLLVSQGYYIEWLRGPWLRGQHTAAAFEPSENAVAQALHRWRAEADDLERRFAATRVPVR